MSAAGEEKGKWIMCGNGDKVRKVRRIEKIQPVKTQEHDAQDM